MLSGNEQAQGPMQQNEEGRSDYQNRQHLQSSDLMFRNNRFKMQERILQPDENELFPAKEQPELSPLEKLISKVDGEGKYQKITFIMFSAMWFLTSWLLLGMTFFFDNSYTCSDPGLTDQTQCKQYICSLPSQRRPDEISWHASSIVFQFDTYLICEDNQNTVSLMQDMMFVGAIFGFFVIPFIADNFGRRLAMRIAWGIGIFAVLITCIADSINMVGLGLFLVGFGTNPGITLCFSFVNEICLGKSRQRYGVGVQVAWAIGETTVALVFQTGLSWRSIMYILLALFVCVGISIQYFLLETPMFFLKKQPEMAFVTLNKMAKVNNKKELTHQDFADLDHCQDKHQLHPQQKSLGLLDLFKFKSVRWTSISGAIIFFGIQAMYYTSSLNQSSVGFSKLTNQILFGVGQTIGYLSAQILIDKCLRKKATFIGFAVSSALCLLLGVLVLCQNEENRQLLKWFQTAALMMNRFVLCCFWSIFYVFIAQLYPTQVRSIGFGWTSVVGMLGSTISPFIKQIADTIGVNSWFPPALFGVIALAFTFCLRQTFGLPLQDTIEERIQTLKKQKNELDVDYPDQDDDQPRTSLNNTTILTRENSQYLKYKDKISINTEE